MRTRSSFNLPVESPPNPSTSNLKRRNCRRSKQPFILEESLVDTMADQRTMAELLRAPTEGYAEAIVVPPILTEQFELKHSLINMMTSDQFFGLEKDNPHNHIRWFNKITSTIKYKDVPSLAINLMLFPFSLAGAARRWLEKEPHRFILTWEDLFKIHQRILSPSRTTNLRNEISNFQQRFDESFHEAWDRYKDLMRACPHHGFTELHQLDTFYNALNLADQDSLNFAVGGNLLERRTQDVLMIIENKSKVRNSRNKSVVSQVKSSDANSNYSSEIAKLTHAINQQTSAVTTAMTAILKQFQATPPPAFVKDNIQGYVAAATVNYNQGNSGYRPSGVANQIRPSGFAQPNVQNNQNRFSQPLGYNRDNNFNQDKSYQAPTQQNQSVPFSELEKIKRVNEANMKAMQTQINNVKNELRNEMKNSIQASMSNQTNELKNMMASFFQMNTASTSGSGSLPSNTIANPKGELKAITNRSGIVLDGPFVPIPPLFINPEEDERVEETLTDQDLAEYTIKVPPPLVQKPKPLFQRNFVVHKRDPLHFNIPYPSRMHKQKQQEKDERLSSRSYQRSLETLGNIFISCGFSELKCKALADLGASINFMPLSVWKKLGLPELIFTRMTIKLANRAICTPAEIARDVFVSISKFTFPADFVIVDYESDPKVPLILGRPFLRTAHALIDVHGEEMILHDGDERLTLNMRHDTSSYSNQPQKESINMINIFDDSKGVNVLPEKLLDLNSTKDLHPSHHVNPLSGSTTSSSLTHLLEEFADELALITFLPGNDDLPFDIESNLKEIEFLLHHDPHKDMDSIFKDSIDQSKLDDLNDNLVDTMPEMFTKEHALDYSSPPLYNEYDDDLFEVESDTKYVYDDLTPKERKSKSLSS
nr:hypothetical protein [Tanacetum cinerariifolium]